MKKPAVSGLSHKSNAGGAAIVLAALLLSAGLIPGCTTPAEAPAPSAVPETEAPEPAAPREEPGTAEARPNPVNREELTITLSGEDTEFDFRKSYLASEAQIYTALYEGLFSYHPFTMEPVPAITDSWKLSEDKKEWTFTLREQARYWNGDPVRAEDFRAAWLSLLDPARDSPYSSLFDIIEGARDYRTGILRDSGQVGVTAPDDKTLVVRLAAPASFFPSMLCHHSFSPIHPSMLEVTDWSKLPPVSNGPFYIVSSEENQLVLAKNEHYWDASRVVLKKINIRFTKDGDEAAALWNSGEARWISGEVNLDALTDRSGIMVNAMFATHYYFIRSGREPWNDYRIRQALSLSLPWGEIREGHYLPAKTLIYPIPGYPKISGVEERDLAEAKILLEEAGYAGGAGLPELVIRLTPSEEAERIGGLMASTWKEELGIRVRVEVIPFERYFQSLKLGDYDVGSSTWIGDFADPYTFLQMWCRDSNLNDAKYSDDEYEGLIEKSMGAEGAERWKLLSEAEELLLDRGTVLPIAYSPALNIIDTDEIDGWFPNALNIHPFKYLSFRAFKALPGVVMAPQKSGGPAGYRPAVLGAIYGTKS
ncbi:MAG: peptide ABC transporter substrate-binding protein [Treponema sp.]|jgi:peptide/nickel transport system substrate-binding protein/oligopeptide transport system substrate-binding protein|nr:peptide ABC transporter substrate-binding protein [Treponema sp.]